MVTLVNSIIEIGNELGALIMQLEDRYEAPELKTKIDQMKIRVADCKTYEPTNFKGFETEGDSYYSFLDNIRFGCLKVLEYLGGIDATGDIFDVIAELKNAYSAIRITLFEFEPIDDEGIALLEELKDTTK